jgi:RiboL-PSP-HEPN
MLRLYELVCDTRKYKIRKDWEMSFKQVMHWPEQERIVRVDGKDRNSVLVLREACGIDRDRFAHDYLSEILRGAVVAAVSALDRYMHDLLVKYSWKLLSRKVEDIPNQLKCLHVTALDTRKALEHLRKDPKARPGHLVKQALQVTLHREFTFQNPDSVLKAAKMLGIEDFWGKVAKEMPGNPTKSDVMLSLKGITARRNQIVHEADLVRTRRAEARLQDISHSQAQEWVDWMEQFGNAIQKVVDATV